MQRIGIFGGTFDPIHMGHLAAAEGAMHLEQLDQVVFLPNRTPPHKPGRPVTAAEHRLAMVRLATAGNPRFLVSELELNREGPSYTIETVRALRTSHPDWEPVFLVGMDSLEAFQTWYAYQELLPMVDWLVMTRPGYGARRDAVLAELGPDLTRRVRFVETPDLEISATDLRRRAAAGYPLRYLVPDPVAEYIVHHRLYPG